MGQLGIPHNVLGSHVRRTVTRSVGFDTGMKGSLQGGSRESQVSSSVKTIHELKLNIYFLFRITIYLNHRCFTMHSQIFKPYDAL